MELNLYGRPLPSLHRPRLAAIACILFACQQVPSIGIGILSLVRYNFFPGSHAIFMFSYMLSVLSAIFFIMGAAILAFANIARSRINPWPFRLMLTFSVSASILNFIARTYLYFAITIPLIPGPSFTRFWDIYVPLVLFTRSCSITSAALALVYLLQLAGFLNSKNLASSSTMLISSAMLVSRGQLAIDTYHLCIRHRLVPYPTTRIFPMIDQALLLAGLCIMLLLIPFFLTLARNLRRLALSAPDAAL